jgi:phosphopentomutase
VDLGIRESFADLGQTVAENFGITVPTGTSFFAELAQAV